MIVERAEAPRYVVDASAAVEFLLKTPTGAAVAHLIARATLVAPELLDVEVVSALRGAVLGGWLEEPRARTALDDLADWQLERIPHRTLARGAWRHLHNVTAYDAFYVAVARAQDAPILTTDGRLSRASGLGVAVQHVRMA